MPRIRRTLSTTTLALGLCAVALLLPGLTPAQTPATQEGMGPIVHDDGVAFRVWAPNADGVSVAGTFNSWSQTANPLAYEENGHWSVNVPQAQVGDEYKYVINYQGQSLWRTDPRATQVVNSVGNGIVADLSYDWEDTGYSMPPWNELVIYEMHVGTFHAPFGAPGTFQQAIERLDHLQDLGINMIQLMPIMEFAGDFSWGYNPSHLFAVESAYGTPRDMKDFVNEAHKRGIGVGLDVVHNHYGPSDLEHMWCFDGPCLGHGGIYFYTDHRANTDWGDTRPDFGRPEVRQFIRDNILFWLEEYRLDLLRFDSTSNMWNTSNGMGQHLPEGEGLLRWINDEINERSPWKISIAEDFHGGDWVTTPTGDGGLGFDSQWTGAYVHPVRAQLITPSDSDRSMWAIHDALNQRYNNNPLQRVVYTESHDEVANGRARVPSEIWWDEPDSWYARKRSTLGGVLTMTAPGIPMLFQGQEFLEEGYFQDTVPLDWTKTETFSGILALYRDLIRLRRNWYNNTRGLRGPHINVFHVNDGANVIAYHRWDQGGVGDDVVIVMNASNTTFPEYFVGMPHPGDWHVIFNSDSTSYSDDYEDFGPAVVTAGGAGMDGMGQRANVPLAPYTALILSQQPLPSDEPDESSDAWVIFAE